MRIDAVNVVGVAFDLGVLRIRLHAHDVLFEGLVHENLAVADNRSVGEGSVLVDGPVGVHLDVDVNCTLDLQTVKSVSARVSNFRKGSFRKGSND